MISYDTHSKRPARLSLLLLLVLTFGLLLGLLLLPNVGRAGSDPLADALARADESGSYRFAATLREELLPKPLPANVGQSGMAYGMQVVGEIQTGEESASRLLLTSLPDGSLPSTTRGPVELVTIGEEVYARALSHPWQRVDNNPAGVAGAGTDYLALLHAASNVVNTDFGLVLHIHTPLSSIF